MTHEATRISLEPPILGGRQRRSGSERLRRQHGLQPPLHPLQLCGWLTLAALSGGALFVLVPGLPIYAQPAAAAAVSVLLLIHLATHFVTSLIDPAEEALRRRAALTVPSLDRAKHAHVIEGGVCHLCQIEVSSRTKHCSACNKCVDNFDHHCKWLNHCIGDRNYGWFLMCISSAVAAAVLVAALAVTNLVYHQVDKDDPSRNTSVPLSHPSSLPSSDAAFLAIVAALGLLAAITGGLLLHLCFFHIYISFLGLTTYEYIRHQRQTTAVPAPPPHMVEDNCEQTGGEVRNRPVDLACEGRTRTFFSCTVLEESFGGCNAEPTPTPPTTPQDCHLCVVGINSVAPEPIKPPFKKVRKKWNCCVSVPDSPEDTEPRCLISMCKHKSKVSPKLDGRSHRTHGYWSSAKLRVLFRIIGNLGRRQRTPPTNSPIQTVSTFVPLSCPGSSRSTLPPLSTPTKRRIISETELASALTMLQQQRYTRRSTRRRRRSVAHRPKSPALSPIRESGLSNPASPSRQSCALAGTCSSAS